MAESSFDRFRRMMDTMQFETLPLFSKPYFQWHLKTDYVGRRFQYRPEAESTMTDAMRMMERFRWTNGTLLLAETQTAGRGRAGRSWVSPPDVNLYFTVLLLPEPATARTLPFVTPLAVTHAIEEVSAQQGVPLSPELKWPNDLLVGGKKVAGVLLETTTTEDGRFVALVGVGINVNIRTADYPEISDIATSLRDQAGFDLPREELLAAFCNHFEALYEAAANGSEAPFAEWRRRLINIGRSVVAAGPDGRIEGQAIDVTSEGALVIQRPDGSVISVEAGDVSLSHAL